MILLLFYSSDISRSWKSISIRGADFLSYYIKIGLYFVLLRDFNFVLSAHGLTYVVLLLYKIYCITHLLNLVGIPHILRVLIGFFRGDQCYIQFENLLEMTRL